ncbi:MAG TPA: hypothetical protein VFO88_08860 [Gaiellaceae bacterium]|nr:hypothetical protein [Gaiellaceae bacterium]
MGLVSWILVGVLVGLAAQRLRPRTFPLRAPGTVLAGVLGASFGGFLAAATSERRIAELDLLTLAAALAGSVAVVVLVAVAGRPRDTQRERS